ncbi:MAG: hypothetical protein H7329_06185 [Opitutaceae bacterium]|nr:hypothetical protein [Cytophagales bacterium]
MKHLSGIFPILLVLLATINSFSQVDEKKQKGQFAIVKLKRIGNQYEYKAVYEPDSTEDLSKIIKTNKQAWDPYDSKSEIAMLRYLKEKGFVLLTFAKESGNNGIVSVEYVFYKR